MKGILNKSILHIDDDARVAFRILVRVMAVHVPLAQK